MTRATTALHQELAAGYPELPGPAVETAIDGAVRAALALRDGGRGDGPAQPALVARLARDRLDVLRARQAAAGRSVRRRTAVPA